MPSKTQHQSNDLESSDMNSFSANVYDNLKNSLSNTSLFNEQDGGKRKKKSGSRKASSRKAGSKRSSYTKVKNIKGGSKKAYSKRAGSKKAKSKRAGSKKSLSKQAGSMNGGKKGSRKSKSKSKSRKSKRALPEKLQEFQKLVKHMKTVVGEHSKFLFTLAKQVRDDITKTNPNISAADLTKKAIKYVDDNKSKIISKYQTLKK
jgi:hypothetical protein